MLIVDFVSSCRRARRVSATIALEHPITLAGAPRGVNMFLLASVICALVAFFTLLIVPGCYAVAMPFAIIAILLAIVGFMDQDVLND